MPIQLGQPMLVSLQTNYRVTDDVKLRCMGQFGTSGMTVEYGADRRISKNNKLGFWLSAGYPHGVLLKVRHVLCWTGAA
jgi:hypothetical protein